MCQPCDPGMIPAAMVMAMVKNAIKQGTFPYMGSTISYVNFIHLKYIDMTLNPKKESQSVFHAHADDTINKQTLTEEELSLKKPNRGTGWPECC